MYYAFFTSTGREFQCEYIEDVFCISHVHGYFEIIFVLEGEINIMTDKNELTADSGKMAMIMPYEVHGFKTPKHSRILVMEFPTEYIIEYKKMFEGRSFRNSIIDMSESLVSFIDEMISEKITDEFSKKAVIYHAVSEYMKKTELVEINASAMDIFKRAVIYISENFTENISQDSVAEALGISSVHLSRILSKQQNISFSEIINSARAQEAKRLMEETDKYVSQVAFDAGFGSIRNFNRICRRYFNCTPTELRNKDKIRFIEKKEAKQL